MRKGHRLQEEQEVEVEGEEEEEEATVELGAQVNNNEHRDGIDLSQARWLSVRFGTTRELSSFFFDLFPLPVWLGRLLEVFHPKSLAGQLKRS